MMAPDPIDNPNHPARHNPIWLDFILRWGVVITAAILLSWVR